MERCGAVIFALAVRLAELFNRAREGERERGTGKPVHDFSCRSWSLRCFGRLVVAKTVSLSSHIVFSKSLCFMFSWRIFLLTAFPTEISFCWKSIFLGVSVDIAFSRHCPFPAPVKRNLDAEICLKQPPDWQTRTQIGIPGLWAGLPHHPRNFYLPFTSHGGETDPICPINRVTRMCNMEFYVKWTWDVKLKWREAVMMWSNYWRCWHGDGVKICEVLLMWGGDFHDD